MFNRFINPEDTTKSRRRHPVRSRGLALALTAVAVAGCSSTTSNSGHKSATSASSSKAELNAQAHSDARIFGNEILKKAKFVDNGSNVSIKEYSPQGQFVIGQSEVIISFVDTAPNKDKKLETVYYGELDLDSSNSSWPKNASNVEGVFIERDIQPRGTVPLTVDTDTKSVSLLHIGYTDVVDWRTITLQPHQREATFRDTYTPTPLNHVNHCGDQPVTASSLQHDFAVAQSLIDSIH